MQFDRTALTLFSSAMRTEVKVGRVYGTGKCKGDKGFRKMLKTSLVSAGHMMHITAQTGQHHCHLDAIIEARGTRHMSCHRLV